MALFRSKTFKCILISAVCFACYGNTIPNDFAYDDAVVITENKFTQRGIAGIPDIFRNNTFAGSYENVPMLERYRPLSLATFAVEHQLFGPSPRVGHVGNVLLFAFTTLVLFLLLGKVFESRVETRGILDLPFLAALLFAVHPVHTEVVANIKGRDEILALAGALCATLAILKYLDARRVRHLLLAFCLFLLALFSKENAATFLAVIPLTVFYYKKGRWSDYLLCLLPLVVASAIFLVVRRSVLGPHGLPPPADIITDPFAYAGTSERLATIVYTLGAYLRLLVFPHPLTIDYNPYHIDLTNWASAAVWLALAAHVALAGYALWNLRKRSIVAYGILIYLVTLSIVSNLPFSLGTFMSERFVFVPSLGFVIVVARLLSDPAFPPLGYRKAIVLALSLACAAKTVGRNAVWKDDFTLLTTDAKTSAGSIKANMAAAVTFLMESHKTGNAGLADEYRAAALEHSRRAVAIYRDKIDPARSKGTSYSHAVTLLGNCYSENGMLEDALRCYREVLETAADRAGLYDAIQMAINKSDDVDFKIRSYSEFVRLAPESFELNYHLGLLHGKEKNDLPRSVLYFQKAVDIAPTNINALRGLAHAHTLSGNYGKAAQYFEKMVEQEPGNLSFLRALRDLHRQDGNQAKESEVTKRIEELEARPER
jgi:tetratricopeptide (TPR) repeat protein